MLVSNCTTKSRAEDMAKCHVSPHLALVGRETRLSWGDGKEEAAACGMRTQHCHTDLYYGWVVSYPHRLIHWTPPAQVVALFCGILETLGGKPS